MWMARPARTVSAAARALKPLQTGLCTQVQPLSAASSKDSGVPMRSTCTEVSHVKLFTSVSQLI